MCARPSGREPCRSTRISHCFVRRARSEESPDHILISAGRMSLVVSERSCKWEVDQDSAVSPSSPHTFSLSFLLLFLVLLFFLSPPLLFSCPFHSQASILIFPVNRLRDRGPETTMGTNKQRECSSMCSVPFDTSCRPSRCVRCGHPVSPMRRDRGKGALRSCGRSGSWLVGESPIPGARWTKKRAITCTGGGGDCHSKHAASVQ